MTRRSIKFTPNYFFFLISNRSQVSLAPLAHQTLQDHFLAALPKPTRPQSRQELPVTAGRAQEAHRRSQPARSEGREQGKRLQWHRGRAESAGEWRWLVAIHPQGQAKFRELQNPRQVCARKVCAKEEASEQWHF